MLPVKIVMIALLAATVARAFLPAALRPKWTTLIPFCALVLIAWYLAAVSVELELMPGLLLAAVASVGAVLELLRPRGTKERSRSSLAVAATIVGTGAKVALLSLAVALPVSLRSGPVIQGPEPLPAPAPLAGSPSGRISVVADHAFLRTPRDLAFNPRVTGELWVVNAADNSVAIIHGAHTGAPRIEYRRDGAAFHFMHRPSAITFGSANTTIGILGTFATAQESQDDAFAPMRRSFMGPTLFSSDLDVFAHPPPEPRLQGSHLDMLHESPLAMGIAWERDHVFWVFGGYHGNIARYDFVEDHGVGHHDHSDGIIRHFGQGVVKRVPGVPSHLVVDRESSTLFIADTGNGRILTLDTTSGTLGGPGPSWEPGVDSRMMADGAFAEIVPAGKLELPSGIALADGLLYVSDNGTAAIHVFTLSGELVTSFDTGLGSGSLMGMTVGPDGRLYFVDAASDRVLSIALPLNGAAGHAAGSLLRRPSPQLAAAPQ